jgi:hypothetical protein
MLLPQMTATEVLGGVGALGARKEISPKVYGAVSR